MPEPLHRRSGRETASPTSSASAPPMPRWVKAFAIIALVVILLIVVMLLVGGNHGPSRHFG